MFYMLTNIININDILLEHDIEKMPFGTIDQNMLWYTGDEAEMNQIASHLCRRGRSESITDLVCINPWHIIFTIQKVNVDHNRCAYGSRSTCPHGVCIWTWPDTGEPKYCLNRGSDLAECTCTRKCQHNPGY